MRPGEQSYYGGRLFCTEPCFNELFLGHCTITKNVGTTANLNKTETEDANLKNINTTTTTKIKTKIETNTNKPETKGKVENTKVEKTKVDKTKVEKAKLETTIKPNTPVETTKIETKQATCLHCTNCERLIINHHHLHHRLNDNYPHCKFPGYKKTVELYLAKQANLTKTLDKKYPNLTANLNRSVQASDFIGQQCIRCLKKVYAAELCYSINFPLHFNCLRCSICDRILQPAAHAVHDGLPICNSPCYNRIYSFGGYRKGWQECKP